MTKQELELKILRVKARIAKHEEKSAEHLVDANILIEGQLFKLETQLRKADGI